MPVLLSAQTGTVEGTVTDALTGVPISGAAVRLYRGDNIAYRVTTDAKGQFRIAGVTEGQYRPMMYGADHMSLARDHPAARTIEITASKPSVSITAQLVPQAQVAGRVLSPAGEPMKGVPVAMRRVWHQQWNMTTVSDEGGFFRLRGLDPGAWILAVIPSFRINLGDAAKNPKPVTPPPAEDGQRVGWATTFFPGVTDLAGAERVVLRPGSRVEGANIRLRTVPLRRLSGTVVDEAGRPLPDALVALKDLPTEGANAAMIHTDKEGCFVFDAAQDGEWRIYGQHGAAPAETLRGLLDVRVSRRDLTGVELRLSTPFPVKGTVEREEQRDSEGSRKVTAIYLMPENATPDLQTSTFHEQDGTFQLKKVHAGKYRVVPAGFVPDYYLASVWYGDQEVTTRAIDIVNPPLPLRIVYKKGAGRVGGTVEKGEGTSVVLVPEDEALRDSDQFIRSAKCGEGGRFSIDTLRPGRYYAFAFDRLEQELLEDAAFVRKLVSQAARVEVRAGETANLELRPQTWPDY